MPTTPERDEGLWVASEVLSGGRYGVVVNVGADRSWPLVGVQAAAYGSACFTIAKVAEYDVAIFRLLVTVLGLSRKVLVSTLHKDRPELAKATAPLEFTGVITRARHPRRDAGAYIPVLSMALDGTEVGTLSIGQMRRHAASVFEVIAAAELDVAFHDALVGPLGLDSGSAQAMVADIARFWPEEDPVTL